MSADLAMTEAEAGAALAQLRDSTPDSAASAVARLYELDAWRALGYVSWRDLCEVEIRPLTGQLSSVQRGEALTRLRGEGIPNKAALAALGIAERFTTKPAPVPSILEEAEKTINGPRLESYGPPLESFDRIAGVWSAYLGIPLRAEDVANLMVMLKVCRTKHGYHRDSYVDIAGFVGCVDQIQQGRATKQRGHR